MTLQIMMIYSYLKWPDPKEMKFDGHERQIISCHPNESARKSTERTNSQKTTLAVQ